MQVAQPKPETKDSGVIKQTGSETIAFQTFALLVLCGAVIVIASKKEKRA